jgi:hypothetical protein
MSNEAKIPPFKFHMEDSQTKPDWGLIANNQITMISQQAAMLENQKIMIDRLTEFIQPQRTEIIVKHQLKMIEAVDHLSDHMSQTSGNQIKIVESLNTLTAHIDTAREQLEIAVGKLSTTMMGIFQVPIAIVIMGVASWAFFFRYIEEYTWLIILAVAAFRYLGDSITAIAKLFGLSKPNNGQTKRTE